MQSVLHAVRCTSSPSTRALRVVRWIFAASLAWTSTVAAQAPAFVDDTDRWGLAALERAVQSFPDDPRLPPGPWNVPSDGRSTWDALASAVDDAPSVVVAARALDIARRNAASTGAPTVRLSVGAQAVDGSRTPLEGADEQELDDTTWTQIAVEARFPLEAFGSNADAAQAARDAVDAADTAWRAARRSVHLAAVRAYLDALRAEAQLGLATERLAFAERQRDATDERAARGAASALDVAQADLDVARADQGVKAAQRAWAASLRSLDQVLGRSGTLPGGEVPRPSVADLLGALTASLDDVAPLQGRPDVAAARRSVDDAVRRRDAAVRDALPVARLDVDWSAGDDRSAFGVAASVDTQSYAPVARFTWDPDDGVPGVGEGGSSSAVTVRIAVDVTWSPALEDALAAVRDEVTRAGLDLDATVEGAVVAGARAVYDLLDAIDAAAVAVESADLARATADLTRLRFDAGSASPATVERADLDAVSATLDALRALDAVYLAVLGTFDTFGVDPPELELR